MKKILLAAIFTILVCLTLFTACGENESPHEHVFGEWVNVKESNCSQAGKQERICLCGEIETKNIEKLPHTEVIDEATEATCTSAGITEGKHCSVCNTVIVAQTVISEKGHSEVTDEAIAPTCISEGKTEGKHCLECDIVLLEQTTLAKTEHNYNKAIAYEKCLISVATCTEKSVYYKSCVCGEIGTETFMYGSDSTNHSGVTKTVIKSRSVTEHETTTTWQCCKMQDGAPVIENHNFINDSCSVCKYKIVYVDFAVSPSNREKIGYTGKKGENLVIPEKFQDTDGKWYKVTSIASFAFENCDNLESVTLPDSIKIIGHSAFYDCTALKSITLPEGITTIGKNAFSYCTKLTSIAIPSSVKTIGNRSFYACHSLQKVNITSLEAWCNIEFDGLYANPLNIVHKLHLNDVLITELVIPDTVTSISDYAFIFCSNITKVTLPSSITNIGNYTFGGCYLLETINIPDGVTSIGNYTFAECYKLSSIDLPASIKTIGSYAFAQCEALSKIVIPYGITSIGDNAFSYCYALQKITLPNSLTTIGDYAFACCKWLTNIMFNGTKEQWNNLSFGKEWDLYLNHYTITCNDGTIKINKGGLYI